MEPLAKILENSSTYVAPTASSAPPTNQVNHQPAEQPDVCPMCRGVGYLRRDLPIDHPDFGKPIACECRKVERSVKRMDELRNLSNLDALVRFTFQTFIPEGYGSPASRRNLRSAYETAYEFAHQPKGWLVILGGYGCGKTHLAAAIANFMIDQGKPAFFVVVPDLLDHLRATFNPHTGVAYDKRFDQIRQAPLLVLDDFGTHSSTSWAQEKLFQLFNYRYNTQLPTVVTSNCELEEIDLRIRSRMSDFGFSQIVKISAPDFRQSGVDQDYSDLSSLSLHDDKRFDTFSLRDTELPSEQVENLRQVYELAHHYAENPQDWLALTGPYGCGKTHLAAAIARRRFSLTDPVLFVTVPDLLDYLRAAFSPTSTTPYDKRFEEVRKSPILVLDDLGTESATPWANEKLYQLFSYRYNARKPTVITMATNANVHPRLKSMLFDKSRCTIFAITAPSYRGGVVNHQPQETKRGSTYSPRKIGSTSRGYRR